jgi:transposase InsO family protein
MSQIKCYNCNKFAGHFSRDCKEPRLPRKGQQQAHLTKTEEEPAALLARVCNLSDDDGPALLMATVMARKDAPTRFTHGPSVHVDMVEEHVFLTKDEHRDDSWFLDTGASNHMTDHRSVFAEMDTNVTGTVKFGDGSVVEIQGRGTVLFACANGEHRALSDVYYIPRLRSNIFSLGQLDQNGCEVHIRGGWLKLLDHNQKLLAKVQRARNRLYVITLNIAQPVCLSAVHDDVSWRWHARYGNLNFDALRKLAHHSMVRGLPRIDHVEQLCDSCLAGKQRRASFPQQAKRRAEGILDLVHGDLCGPITPSTPAGKRYFLLLVDDLSRYMWLTLLTTKDEAAAIKRFRVGVEVETGRKLKLLRTDRGGEFTVATFATYCADEGIGRQLTAPYSPQQNGVVERRNQTIVSTARSLMKAKGAPARFWGEAVTTAVYLLNRSPTKSVSGKTPFEVWHGYKPDVSYLRVFGCVAHVKVTKPNQTKLDDRSAPMVLFGYEPGSAAYRVFDPVGNRLHVTRDVIFDEGAKWDWERTSSASSVTPFTVEHLSFPYSSGGTSPPTSASEGTPRGETASPPAATPSPAATRGTPTHDHASPASTGSCSGGDRTPTPPRQLHPMTTRSRDGIVQPNPRYADYVMAADVDAQEADDLCLAAVEEPPSVEAAMNEPCWRHAMNDELASIHANDTLELATLPAGHRAIGLKWVFKVKKDPAGNVVKNKARLVAKGYA